MDIESDSSVDSRVKSTPDKVPVSGTERTRSRGTSSAQKAVSRERSRSPLRRPEERSTEERSEPAPGNSNQSEEGQLDSEEYEPWPDVLALLPTWLAQGQPESVIKSIREHFKTFDAFYDFPKCPLVDDSVGRLLLE